MFRCPLCGASARIRTSRSENDSNTVRKKYYQCNNLECGVCFSTLEAFHKFTSKHASGVHSSEGIPWHDLPASHRGNNQMSLPLSELTGRIAGVTKKR
ncbi:ogr/Delta-like zinc finger family protein [Escherichia coli]|nr:ogr/Delta-like zinc finger family protein [Escherichia coli]